MCAGRSTKHRDAAIRVETCEVPLPPAEMAPVRNKSGVDPFKFAIRRQSGSLA